MPKSNAHRTATALVRLLSLRLREGVKRWPLTSVALCHEVGVIITDVTGIDMHSTAKREEEITYLQVPHLLPHGLLQDVHGTALQEPQADPALPDAEESGLY